jgi:hypothetical protein
VIGFVLVAVFAQIFRNWLLLDAVGVDASFFDAIAVLIAVVTLTQLPVGPSVGAAAAVLILGSDGVAAVGAAGVLMTVTGTVDGLCFAGWAGADRLWSISRGAAWRRAGSRAPRWLGARSHSAPESHQRLGDRPDRGRDARGHRVPACRDVTVEIDRVASGLPTATALGIIPGEPWLAASS